MIDKDILAVQRAYPKIYLACHSDHVRSSSTTWRLSAHDSSILAHLDPEKGMAPRDLQRHLGVAASSLSASLKRLEHLGYVSNEASSADRRRREVRLTTAGVEAMQGTSVLDRERLRQLLEALSDDERQSAIRGLELLAYAAMRSTLTGAGS